MTTGKLECLSGLSNYWHVFERKDRYGKSGGGILVYISKSVQYKRRHDLESDHIRDDISRDPCSKF